MAYTYAEHCKCGGAILINRGRHRDSWAHLIHDFREQHSKCVKTDSRNDDHPEGDVYASTQMAGQHSQHELQIGFQRETWW